MAELQLVDIIYQWNLDFEVSNCPNSWLTLHISGNLCRLCHVHFLNLLLSTFCLLFPHWMLWCHAFVVLKPLIFSLLCCCCSINYLGDLFILWVPRYSLLQHFQECAISSNLGFSVLVVLSWILFLFFSLSCFSLRTHQHCFSCCFWSDFLELFLALFYP